MPHETFSKKVLGNGLTIITVSRPTSPTGTVLVLVRSGSKYETKDINGISHFLEHMCFKGTKKRPRAIDISGELDALGAHYNAFTSHEYTGYYAKVGSDALHDALDVVSDIYLNQIFREGEIERESGVIVEEINMIEDDPKRKIYDNFTALLYGDQPAGWDIAGTRDTVRAVRKHNLEAYRKEQYVASATVVVCTGNIDEKKLLSLIEKKFSSIRSGTKKEKLPVFESQKKPEIAVLRRPTDQSHFMIGVRTFPIYDKRAIALRLLSTILGGGMSSRLWQTVRERLGAGYYIASFTDLYTDHGYLAVSCGADTKRVREVIGEILAEFRKLTETPVGKKELAKAKDYLIGTTAVSLETTDALASYYGSQEVLKEKILTPPEFMKAIRKVSAADVRSLARQIFRSESLNCALIGPQEKKELIESMTLS